MGCGHLGGRTETAFRGWWVRVRADPMPSNPATSKLAALYRLLRTILVRLSISTTSYCKYFYRGWQFVFRLKSART